MERVKTAARHTPVPYKARADRHRLIATDQIFDAGDACVRCPGKGGQIKPLRHYRDALPRRPRDRHAAESPELRLEWCVDRLFGRQDAGPIVGG